MKFDVGLANMSENHKCEWYVTLADRQWRLEVYLLIIP